MNVESAYKSKEVEIFSSPVNSILAAAATAWDLDIAYKEAEAEGKEYATGPSADAVSA